MSSALDRKRARNKRESEAIDHYFAVTVPEAWSWYSPTSYYYAVAAPSAENTAKAGFQMGLSYGVFAGVNYATGSLAPYNPFYHTIQRAYGMAYNVKTVARYGAHLGASTGSFLLRNAPFIGAVIGATSVVANPTDNWLFDVLDDLIFEPWLGDFTFGEES
ncbi:MAG: hypothetical protein [Circular genetic element sp.]|nr:MAG: hypothetical protein [Circular genetic element sp.]